MSERDEGENDMTVLATIAAIFLGIVGSICCYLAALFDVRSDGQPSPNREILLRDAKRLLVVGLILVGLSLVVFWGGVPPFPFE